MNVLFVTHCTPMDGGNQSLLQLMTELMESPYNVTPILLTPLEIKSASSSIVKEARSRGIKCITSRFYQFKHPDKSLKNYARWATNFVNLPTILRKLKGTQVDLVHSNSSIIDIGSKIAKTLKVPHIWHLREFGDLDFNLRPLFGEKQEINAYRHNAHRFIAISESVKTRFSSIIDPDEIDVIYNGIPSHSTLSPAAHKSSIINFCITGALNRAKGQMEAVKALDRVVNKAGVTNVHLTIIGEGPDRNLLTTYIDAHRLRDYVTLEGWMPNPAESYSRMDAGLMLSASEAFGRVTVEYMRSNLLVIASDRGANRELVDDGVTGLLYTPTADASNLADKMLWVINNPSEAWEIAKRGYEFSQNNFLSTENTKAVFKTYQRYGTNSK